MKTSPQRHSPIALRPANASNDAISALLSTALESSGRTDVGANVRCC